MTTIEKIKAEIERQMKFYDEKEMRAWKDPEQGDEDALWYQGHRKMCAKLLSFLSTLEEEIPTDLEEAAKKYAHCPYTDDDGNFYEDAIDGTAYRDFIAGAKWQKQEMMKETVEGVIEEVSFNNGEKHNTIRFSFDEESLHVENRIWFPRCGKDGDKVRIIVLKQE